MKMIGTVNFNGNPYFLAVRDNKNNQVWILISPYHVEDRQRILAGKEPNHFVFENTEQFKGKTLSDDYIVEMLDRSKIKKTVKKFNSCNILYRIIDDYNAVMSYKFLDMNILLNKEDNIKKKDNLGTYSYYKQKLFQASEDTVTLNYERRDKLFVSLSFNYGNTKLNISEGTGSAVKTDVKLIESTYTPREQNLYVGDIADVDMNVVRSKFNISFYEDPVTHKKKKEYSVIDNIRSFEKNVMQPLADTLKECIANGEQLIFGLDTETDGLNIYELSKENPFKSKIVATPLSWKDNQGVVVFNDMEFFDNVPVDYMMMRLKPLIERQKDSVELTLEVYDFPEDVDVSFTEGALIHKKVCDKVNFKRSDINLVGHNAMFDGRVFYDNGAKPYFDNDTLQMAFVLNPQIGKSNIQVLRVDKIETPDGIKEIKRVEEVKGGVGLKSLTHRNFGHDTADLTSLLGKGNETAYRFIADKEVAAFYGCADTDYTRLNFKFLKNLMPTRMYNKYRQQDMPLENVLYISAYKGLTVNAEEVKKLAEQTAGHLQEIKNFLYSYVGRYVYFKEKSEGIRIRYKADKLVLNSLMEKLKNKEITQEEFERGTQNLYSKELRDKDLARIDVSKAPIYQFELKASDMRTVLFDILEYEVVGYTKTGMPKTDKFTMEKLMSFPGKEKILNEDVKSSDGTVLIEADEFNKYKYPIAYVLSLYAKINKEYTSYLAPITKTNLEGRLFRDYSMARIITRRIMNALQTMNPETKTLTLPYDGGKDYAMWDFDMAQVEYRVMLSLAWLMLKQLYPGLSDEEVCEKDPRAKTCLELINRLKNPENDFHREAAAMVFNMPPYKIPNALRKKMKTVHFGIPYGIGVMSMCYKIFGDTTKEHVKETKSIKDKFESRIEAVIDLLETTRDKAFEPAEFSPEFKRFAGYVHYTVDEKTGEIVEHLHDVGKCENLLGFYRLFDLEGLDNKKRAIIRRAAGNYPIQSFAAEVFRIILMRFYNRCVDEGIEDKVVWHMLIHDELLFSVHKSVHPFKMYKILYESCMITIKDHTNYFIGINVGNSWKECKLDESEAPVLFVKRMIERWDAGEFKDEGRIENVREYVEKHKEEFTKQRIHEFLVELQPDIDTEPIRAEYLFDNFSNYAVKGYLDEDYKEGTGEKDSDELRFVKTLNNWACDYYGEGKEILDFNNQIFKSKLHKDIKDLEKLDMFSELGSSSELDDDLDDLDELDEDEEMAQYYDSYSFDEDGFHSSAEDLFFEDHEYNFYEEQEDEEEEHSMEEVIQAKTSSELIIEKSKFKYVTKRDNFAIVSISSKRILSNIEKFLEKDIKSNGIQIRIMKDSDILYKCYVKYEYDLYKLDLYIRKLTALYELKVKPLHYIYSRGSNIIIKTIKNSMSSYIINYLEDYRSDDGLQVYLDKRGQLSPIGRFNIDFDLNNFNSLLESVSSLKVKASGYDNIVVQGGSVIITCDTKNISVIKDYLRRDVSSIGYTIKFKTKEGISSWLKIKRGVDLEGLDKFIGGVIKCEL